jgi:hypothetical protein
LTGCKVRYNGRTLGHAMPYNIRSAGSTMRPPLDQRNDSTVYFLLGEQDILSDPTLRSQILLP